MKAQHQESWIYVDMCWPLLAILGCYPEPYVEAYIGLPTGYPSVTCPKLAASPPRTLRQEQTLRSSRVRRRADLALFTTFRNLHAQVQTPQIQVQTA